MLFLFFKSDDFTGTYVLLSESVDKSLAKYARGVSDRNSYDMPQITKIKGYTRYIFQLTMQEGK